MPLKTSKPKKAAGFVKPGPKKTKKPVPVPEPEEDSDDEDMSDSSEEAVPVPVTKNAKKNMNGIAAADSDDDSEEDSDDDSEEEEEEEPVKVTKAKKAVNGNKKQAVEVEEDDDDDDDEEDDSEEESEEEEAAPVKAKAVKAKKAMEVEEDDEEDSDEDDDEEESDEEDDEEEDDDEEAEMTQKKRKATGADTPAKKAKIETVVSLYVANLATDIEEAKIRKFFKKQGINVSDVRHKAPKTFCYVDLEDSSDLEKALALSGQKLKGQEVKIEQAKQRNETKAEKKTPQKDDTPKKRADDNCLLFVKNLPEDVTKEMLAEVFSDAKDVRLPLNQEGNMRGFAFVEFHTEADVDTAMEEKQGADVGGRSLFLDYTGSKSKGAKKSGSFGGAPQQRKSFGEAGKTKVLFVKNLSFNLTKESLQEAFDGATTARIATFPDTGKPRGFGFVEFDSPSDATAAFEAMNGTELDGRELKLDYATEQQNSPRPFGGRGGGRGGRGGFDRGGRGGFRGGRGFGGGRGRGGDRGGRGRGGFRGGRGGSTEFKGSRKSFDD